MSVNPLGDTFSNPLKGVFDGLNKQFDLIRDELNKTQVDFSKVFEKSVYVQPELFKKLEAGVLKNIQDKLYKIKDGDEEYEIADIKGQGINADYYILSHHDENSTTGQIQFRTSREIALLVREMTGMDREKLYKIDKAAFNSRFSELNIGGSILPIIAYSDVYRLCRMLFGSPQYITKKWNWQDIEDRKVIADILALKNPERALYQKVARLNNRIHGLKPEIKNLILYKNKSVFVNPKYYYLFN